MSFQLKRVTDEVRERGRRLQQTIELQSWRTSRGDSLSTGNTHTHTIRGMEASGEKSKGLEAKFWIPNI